MTSNIVLILYFVIVTVVLILRLLLLLFIQVSYDGASRNRIASRYVPNATRNNSEPTSKKKSVHLLSINADTQSNLYEAKE